MLMKHSSNSKVYKFKLNISQNFWSIIFHLETYEVLNAVSTDIHLRNELFIGVKKLVEKYLDELIEQMKISRL